MTARKNKLEKDWYIWLLFLIIAAFLCSRFFFQMALIQGNSMEPNYHHLQLVLINKCDDHYSAGDVIIFRKNCVGVVIKRIVAVPGDSVQISNGVLCVNGKDKTGKYEHINHCGRADVELVMEDGKYFVLGDNVNGSIDSRFEEIGDVDAREILGKVVF